MPVTFRDMIATNKRNSVLLVAIFVLFTMVLALVLTLAILFLFDESAATAVNLERSVYIGLSAAAVAFLLALWGYYQGDQLVLAVSGAKPIQHQDDPQLFNVVEEMAIAAGIPMPQVYLILDAAPNAFATGRDPQHAVVAITTGLRCKLNREELQGVIAHEIGHIRNYDIRLMLLMAVLVGTVVMLSDMFLQILRFGRPSSNSDSGNSGGDRDKGKGLIMLVVLVFAILLALIAPLLANLIQLAVSRQREYLADASAAELTRNPIGLANALRKIDADPAPLRHANRGMAHLYIANPIKKFAAGADTIFASHPPIQDRIARLEALVRV